MKSRHGNRANDAPVDHEEVTNMLQTDSGTNRRRSGWRRAAGQAGAALSVLLLVVWAGCKNPLNVTNPNKLTEEDVSSPSAYGSLVGGSLNNLERASAGMLAIINTASDEAFWIGSRDAWGALDKGRISDPTNEFTDATWPYVGEARYIADKAIIEGEQLQSDGTLPSPDLLAQAYLYGGTLYTLIADTWQRYVLPSDLTDPTEAGKPIAASSMPGLYDTAIGYFTKGLGVVKDAEIKAELMAMRARAKQAKVIREKIQGGNPTAGSGLVPSPDAVADAQTALGMIGSDNGWRFRLDFSYDLLGISCESWAGQVWDRGELQVGDQGFPNNSYVYLSTSNKQIDSVRLRDPIDGVLDPEFSSQLSEFQAGGKAAGMTEMSTRELHLIVAEDALANADTATFASEINTVRGYDGLTDWDMANPQIPAKQMLEYERNVNLIWQGRRLADHYRFGSQDPLWQPNSVAATQTGTLFPITITEIRSNPNVSG